MPGGKNTCRSIMTVSPGSKSLILIHFSKAWWIDATNNAETYYIYFADCESNLSRMTDRDSLIFSFDVSSEEGGHFGKGEEYLLTIHYLFGLLTALAYIPFMRTFYREIRKGLSEMNYPFMVINFCIVLKFASMIFEVLDLKIT